MNAVAEFGSPFSTAVDVQNDFLILEFQIRDLRAVPWIDGRTRRSNGYAKRFLIYRNSGFEMKPFFPSGNGTDNLDELSIHVSHQGKTRHRLQRTGRPFRRLIRIIIGGDLQLALWCIRALRCILRSRRILILREIESLAGSERARRPGRTRAG